MINHYDFDKIPNRSGTGSLKWERYSKNILPMWVADMDFETAPEITEALKNRLSHKVFGYTIPYDSVIEAVLNYLKYSHNYAVKKESLTFLPGLVPAINLCCNAFSTEEESVMTVTPVYPPFITAPRFSGRELITVPLILDSENKWTFNIKGMEKAIKPNTKIFILCNPHNPVGRAYTKLEIEKISDFCQRYNLILISDEIHCDLIFDTSSKHTLVAGTEEGIAERTITLMSPSKTYNLPGLACAYSIIENPKLKLQFEKTIRGIITEINCFGYVGCEAAYRYGNSWRIELLKYLEKNYLYLNNFLCKKIPEIEFIPMEATYLAWLKVDRLNLNSPTQFFEKYGVGLSDGIDFGDQNYVRLNFGCPHSRLMEALERMHKGLLKENVIGHEG